ncbi:MAG: class I lanthipeptide [Candidatus Omnitrophota bacterium]
MNSKKLTRKLELNKTTITTLNGMDMTFIKAGSMDEGADDTKSGVKMNTCCDVTNCGVCA